MSFYYYYKRDIYGKDSIYKKWIEFFPKMKTGLNVCIIGLNFKCFKMSYSGFFGLESTQAQFNNHTEVFRLMRLHQYFSYVFIYGLIFIADILIFLEAQFCT